MRTILMELERAYDTLNEHLFEGRLLKSEFILQPKKRVKLKYVEDSGQIIVGGDLVVVETVALLADLLHQMVHISNAMKGIADCRTTRSTQYHNKHFLNAALDVGLTVNKHPARGWDSTTITTMKMKDTGQSRTPTSAAIDRRVRAFDAVSFDKAVLRQAKADIVTAKKTRRSTLYTLKYQCKCPPPHNSIRSGRRPYGDHPLNIKCENCGSLFVCVDIDK